MYFFLFFTNIKLYSKENKTSPVIISRKYLKKYFCLFLIFQIRFTIKKKHDS